MTQKLEIGDFVEFKSLKFYGIVCEATEDGVISVMWSHRDAIWKANYYPPTDTDLIRLHQKMSR